MISRYSRPAMARIWSDEARLARMLEVELAALAGWSVMGVVPADAVDHIAAAAKAPTPERVAELERETNHDVAAFVDAVADGLGDDGRWFHFGLTSSDVLDTAFSSQFRKRAHSYSRASSGLFTSSSTRQRRIGKRSAWAARMVCMRSRRRSG